MSLRVSCPDCKTCKKPGAGRAGLNLVTVRLLVFGGGLLSCVIACAVGQEKQLPETENGAGKAPPALERVVFDFRDAIETYPALTLEGPDAHRVAKTDAEGLQISIPAGQRDTRPVVVKLAHRLHGDFDVALGYELLSVGEPIGQYGAGVLIRAWFDTASPLSAIVSRFKQRDGAETFGAHWIVQGPDGKEQWLNNASGKATQTKGKLRLVRTGPQLHYLVAEDGVNFIALLTVAIGTADVRSLEVMCHTQYTPISLDARLTQLAVAAEQFPDGIPSERASAPAGAPRKTVILLVVLTLLCLGGVTMWLLVRHRKSAEHKETIPDPAPAPELPTTLTGAEQE
jgi:hypothetical protein